MKEIERKDYIKENNIIYRVENNLPKEVQEILRNVISFNYVQEFNEPLDKDFDLENVLCRVRLETFKRFIDDFEECENSIYVQYKDADDLEKVKKAYEEGKTIQHLNLDDEWVDCDMKPGFSANHAYRVKPEEECEKEVEKMLTEPVSLNISDRGYGKLLHPKGFYCTNCKKGYLIKDTFIANGIVYCKHCNQATTLTLSDVCVPEKSDMDSTEKTVREYYRFGVAKYALSDVIEALENNSAKEVSVTKEDGELVVSYKPYWRK